MHSPVTFPWETCRKKYGYLDSTTGFRKVNAAFFIKARLLYSTKLSAKYEVLYIIDPAQGEEGIAALVEKFKGIVEAHGTLTSVDEWGKRRLAYPINDLIEGYYVYMTCEVTPEMPAELDRVFKITDGILRSIIVAVEE